MLLKEIIEKCSGLNIYEKRGITDEYAEFVFYNKEQDKWNKVLVDILGPAIKPPGLEPTEDDLRLTKEYGGIYINQTLFKKEFDDFTIIAMCWPWQDGMHTTLKMSLLKK